jgi:predicted XRE-type DNA-binding protein
VNHTVQYINTDGRQQSEPAEGVTFRAQLSGRPAGETASNSGTTCVFEWDLLIEEQKTIAARGLKHAETARLLKVSEPRVSGLLRGRLALSVTDAPIDVLARLHENASDFTARGFWPSGSDSEFDDF